jgi:hypothetical protein
MEDMGNIVHFLLPAIKVMDEDGQTEGSGADHALKACQGV